MATKKAKAAPIEAEVPTSTPAVPRSRGPRGTSESAVINLLVSANPKREGSKAHAAFSNYVDGMTIAEFADAVGKEATPNLVYDSKHGFIAIEGYEPPGGVLPPKEPKAPKAAAAPKVKREKKEKIAKVEAEVEAEAQEEIME